jgi:hypothetical protein
MSLVYAGPGVEVVVPLDVEAGVIMWLRSMGVWASTQVPKDRTPGMIRVSRVGGELIKDGVRDQPRMLVEGWHVDQEKSWDQIIRLYGLFVYAGQTQAIPAIGVTRCRPTPPVTLEDYDAPELYRHQFEVDMMTQMGTLTV